MDLATGTPDLSGGDPLAGPELSTTEQKKRNRIRFSCTTCREKKLKCDRQLPCDQCQKRDIASTCKFVPYANLAPDTGDTTTVTSSSRDRPPACSAPLARTPHSRRRTPAADSSVQSRLKHLERLIHVLKTQRKNKESLVSGPSSDERPGTEDGSVFHCANLKETAGLIIDELRYVDTANWEAILDEISTISTDLKTDDEAISDSDEHDSIPDALPPIRGPVLFLGTFPQVTVEQILAHLPPRPVADRLLAKFFEMKEPAWMIFHIPTFSKDYQNFWEHIFWEHPPEKVSCVGLLFFVFAHAALYCHRIGEEVPGNLGRPLEIFETFKHLGAQCLAHGDYTTPGRYKVEAMILYFGCEYLAQQDAAIGTSVLFSAIIRLAMHMGMHRDPRHYRGVTPYEGEMRRRIWALLVELDVLLSFQFGVPSNINHRFCDTEPPRNLHDDDYEETSKEIPPSRPETERTVTLYSIVKGRLSRVFGNITAAISSRERLTYSELLVLDKQLKDVHDSFPPVLRYRPFSKSLVDPTELIIQRYWLELLYQKSRLVLHRRYIGIGRLDKRYAYSRRTCLDAATEILQHQDHIHCEMQLGGRLAKDRWFVNCLSIHDFLLADMVLCLELSYLNAHAKMSSALEQSGERDVMAPDVVEPEVKSRDQIMEHLRTSRLIWKATRKDSAEVNRAFKILTKMLTVSTGDAFESSPALSEAAPNVDNLNPYRVPMFHFGAPTGSSFPSHPPPEGNEVNTEAPSGFDGSFMAWGSNTCLQQGVQPTETWATNSAGLAESNLPSGDKLEGLLEPSLISDWSLWDNQIQNASAETFHIPWHDFFQPCANGPRNT